VLNLAGILLLLGHSQICAAPTGILLLWVILSFVLPLQGYFYFWVILSFVLPLQGYFYFWVILSFVWGLVAAAVATTLPIIESRFIIYSVAASALPCFPILKRWAHRKEHGLSTGQNEPDSDDDLPKEDPKVEQYVQQPDVARPDAAAVAQNCQTIPGFACCHVTGTLSMAT